MSEFKWTNEDVAEKLQQLADKEIKLKDVLLFIQEYYKRTFGKRAIYNHVPEPSYDPFLSDGDVM